MYSKKRINRFKFLIEKHFVLFFMLAGFFIIVGLLLTPKIYTLCLKINESFKNKKLVEDKLLELESKKIYLENEQNRLTTDLGLETEIRNKFPVVKDGEEMVVFVDDLPSNTNQEQVVKEGFWQKFKNLFK